ncbi:major facilitator superfamily domain-containing protein [Aspergillus unguis]
MVQAQADTDTSAPVDLPALLNEHGLQLTPDAKFVRWSSTNQEHPRNWSTLRKLYDTSIIIFLDLYTTAISTAGSSAADHAYEEYNINRILSIFIFVSLYLIGQGIGGVVFPATSEAFGRKRLYIVSTAVYSVGCIIVGVVPHIAGAAVGRFISGFFSAMPTIVVAGSIEDMYNSKGRVWLIFLWALVANAGLCLGPIMSVYIISVLNWRWVFYIAAIVTAITTVLLFFIRESRPSLILTRHVAKVQSICDGNHHHHLPRLHHHHHHHHHDRHILQPLNPDHTPSLRTFAREALFRPVILFFTEPIVFLVSTMSAIAFALVYLFTEALPPIYQSMGFSETASSLPFLAIAIGLACGLFTRLMDNAIMNKYEKEGVPPQPEHKLLGFSIGAPVLSLGLWWFAWTIPPIVPNVHWIVSCIALVLIGYALNEFDAVLAGYLADSYLSYAASGFAALAFLRAILSAVFPLFATQMFDGLGANVAASVLAAVATVFCLVPPLFGRFGKRIRANSPFARYSLKVYLDNSVEKEGY